MNPILARLRTLIAFVTGHSVSVDLRPETEDTEAMIRAYYSGVDHLRWAFKDFLAAKVLSDKLHKE